MPLEERPSFPNMKLGGFSPPDKRASKIATSEPTVAPSFALMYYYGCSGVHSRLGT